MDTHTNTIIFDVVSKKVIETRTIIKSLKAGIDKRFIIISRTKVKMNSLSYIKKKSY